MPRRSRCTCVRGRENFGSAPSSCKHEHTIGAPTFQTIASICTHANNMIAFSFPKRECSLRGTEMAAYLLFLRTYSICLRAQNNSMFFRTSFHLHRTDWRQEAVKFLKICTQNRLPTSGVQRASETETRDAPSVGAADSKTQVMYICWWRTRKTQLAL